MKKLIYVFILIVLCHPAVAMDIILVTVRSVDSKSGKLVLQIIAPTKHHKKKIIVHTNPVQLPKYVAAGKVLRVWGIYTPKGITKFRVLHIRPGHFHGCKKDPTGVRSRIGKRKKRFRHRFHHKGHLGH